MFLRATVYCLSAATIMLIAAAGAGSPTWQYASGLVMCAAFLPYLLRGPVGAWRRFLAVWFALMTVSVITLASEALIFIHLSRRERITSFIGALVVYSLLAVAIAVLSSVLEVNGGARIQQIQPGRRAPHFLLRVLASGAAYAVYYYVFGAVAFFLFTKPYYSGTGPLAGAQEAARSLGWWLPLIQIGRGSLMALGFAPILFGLRMTRATAAIYIGMLLWTIGGLAPLIPPNTLMPGRLRAMHTIEIFSQNVPLGITAVLLLRRKETAAPRERLQVEAARL